MTLTSSTQKYYKTVYQLSPSQVLIQKTQNTKFKGWPIDIFPYITIDKRPE